MKLEQFRNTLQSTLRQNPDLFYPHTLGFVLGNYPPYPVNCRVLQPARPEHKAILERMVPDFGPSHRLLFFHPDSITPPLSARAPYQGGSLEVVGIGQMSEYKGKRPLAALFTI